MNRFGTLLTRHRNLFLLLLLLSTLLVSSIANRTRLERAASTVNIPVTEVVAQPDTSLERFRRQRDETARADRSALEALCAQENLDSRTREDAALRLTRLVDEQQKQTAMEGALINSSLSPCVAVVTGSSLTLVTQKQTLTGRDTALVMSLAQTHVGSSPEEIRIITAE